MKKFLESGKIKLRALEPGDLDLLYSWENNTDVWKVSNTLTPFSMFTLKQFIESAGQDIYQTKQLRLVIVTVEKKSKPVGCIDIFDFDPHHGRAGIGILIASENDRGKGFASDALDATIDYAFEILHLHQLYCNITEDNKTSIALFKKKGFKKTGSKTDWIKTGSGYLDEFTFQLLNK
ncbi:MAG: GNAT family N-acetyltransferase [Bacteroidetes bacterium GWF2_38_335]|nr:MAG: GNAT family N-acetyltransferase [Bacteroidetes bacterium GWF2_38_335]OFY79131.1 MAG: GNAT family N-acetyltransferase [Bacteroidetes bacterium RIFOXYA12_FULL_38_20]HBS88782.1 GNAT family N-acetyltransferase [Bacteroidales bacterium]